MIIVLIFPADVSFTDLFYLLSNSSLDVLRINLYRIAAAVAFVLFIKAQASVNLHQTRA